MTLRSSFVPIMISICLLLFIPTLSAADNGKLKIYRIPQTKSKKPITIYSDPNPHSKVITKLPTKTRWIVKLSGVKKYSSSTWLHISWNKKKGWMKKKHLIFDSQATNIATKNPKCLLNTTRIKSCDPS